MPGAAWEPEDLASFIDAADFHQEPYSPTVTAAGPLICCVFRLGSVGALRVLSLGAVVDN